MERLLYSSSPTSLKPLFKHLPLLPRLGRIDPSNLHFPSSTRSQFSGLNSFSCRNEKSVLYSCSSSPLHISSDSLLSLTDSRDGSAPKPHFLQQIQILPSGERKVSWQNWSTVLFLWHCCIFKCSVIIGIDIWLIYVLFVNSLCLNCWLGHLISE